MIHDRICKTPGCFYSTHAWGDGYCDQCQLTHREIKAQSHLSDCCTAPVRTEGETTRYYVCEKCGQACDLEEDEDEN